jgi:iron complex outermembrane receptor protein
VQYGGRVNLDFNPVELGFQFKRVGSRFATDVNDIKVKGYTVADADVRVALEPFGLKASYFQVNVSNLFDEEYFGNISTQIRAADNPNFTLSSPRTVIASLNLGF